MVRHPQLSTCKHNRSVSSNFQPPAPSPLSATVGIGRADHYNGLADSNLDWGPSLLGRDRLFATEE